MSKSEDHEAFIAVVSELFFAELARCGAVITGPDGKQYVDRRIGREVMEQHFERMITQLADAAVPAMRADPELAEFADKLAGLFDEALRQTLAEIVAQWP